MCVAAIAWNMHAKWRLVIASNRDEFHDRPATPLGHWHSNPDVLAGRDVRAGGTWLGVSRLGRAALITNFRVPAGPQPGRPSRGDLVLGWLQSSRVPEIATMTEFNPFNLFVADSDGARLITNYPAYSTLELGPGIHGISNGSVSQPWPKTRQLSAALAAWLAQNTDSAETLFYALRRETPLPPAEWRPDEPEPRLAPVFIRDPVYGTRCSTVVLVARDGSGHIIERRFDPEGAAIGEVKRDFAPATASSAPEHK